jgi:putative copper export protein
MIMLVDLGAVFWVGTQLWRTFVSQPSDDENQEQDATEQYQEQRFERFFSVPVLFVIFLANIGVLIGQGLLITGGNWGQALAPSILLGLARNGRFGTYWTMREIVLVLAALLALYAMTIKPRVRQQGPLRVVNGLLPWANLILGLALLIAITLSGHAAATSSNILVYAVLVDWLHLLAASLWVGGMMYISTIFLPSLKSMSLEKRTGTLLATIGRFSPLAITGVIIMAVSGPFNAVVHMNSLEQLITTAYGRTLIVKVLLVGGLLLTSAIHVGLFRPRLAKDYKKYSDSLETVQDEGTSESDATIRSSKEFKQLEGQVSQQTRRLTTVLRWEPLLGVAVLVCTGLLNVFAGTLTPAAIPQQQTAQQQQQPAQSKPFATTVQTTDKKYTIKLSVTPNRFGTNVFTASVLDSQGKPDTNVGVSIYTTMLDMDMGTNALNLQPDGKGSFSANGDLDMGGNWQLRVQIRTPDNTLHEAKVTLFTPY